MKSFIRNLLFSVTLVLFFASASNATVIPVNAFYTLTSVNNISPSGIFFPQATPLPFSYVVGINAICDCPTSYGGNYFWWDSYQVDTYTSTDNVLDDSIDTLVNSVTYSPSGSSHTFFNSPTNLVDLTNYSFTVFTFLTNNTVNGSAGVEGQYFYMWNIELGHVVCVPEPSISMLMAGGLGLFGFVMRKRKSAFI